MLKITVAIPTYNRGKSIKPALEAITKQDFPKSEYELIIVDDGGNDSTKEIVGEFSRKSGFPIRYSWQKNKGPAAARNLAILNSKSPIIAFTDDDCIPNPDWLEKILSAFSNDSDAMIIGGETLPPKGNLIAKVGQGLTKNAFFDNVNGKREAIFFPTCNAAFRKEVFKKAGCFDEDFPIAAGEDLEFSWRCFKKGLKLLYAPDAIVTHYCTPNLRAYARQSFNYGRGNYIAKLKQPDHPEIRMLETGGNIRFLWYCVMEVLEAPRFAFLFTVRIKKWMGISGLKGTLATFFILLVHRFSYLSGNIRERKERNKK
ncbi:MAG: glycosyltransferase [Candidatus Woesearchaeota archaeon]|nr:glycosyltransferase [Candidatus Woesearchaeota archaeon]